MRWLAIAFLVACVDATERPSLEGPFVCGPKTCESGEVCAVETAGLTCNVPPGGMPFQEIGWSCAPPPEACDGVPSCDCMTGPGMCFGVSEESRRIDFGCY